MVKLESSSIFLTRSNSVSVCELLSNPKEAKRLGANARTFAIDNFDMEKVCLPRQIAWVESLYK